MLRWIPDQAREQGSRDWRLIPAAAGVWTSALLCGGPVSGGTLITLAALAVLTVVCAAAMILAARGDRAEDDDGGESAAAGASGDRRAASASHRGVSVLRRLLRFVLPHLAVVCAGMLVAGLSAAGHAWVESRGPVRASMRERGVPVVVAFRADEPPVSSDRRGYDCRCDGTVTALLQDGVLTGDHASVRVYATAGGCALRQGGIYRMRGTLERPEFGTAPAWISADGTVGGNNAVQELHPPSALRRAVHATQSAFVRVTQRLSPQGQLLVPGLTLGMLGSDVADLSMRDPSVPPINPVYATRVEDAFRTSGIMHLMAVSGGHFALIGVLARRLCGLLHIGRPVMPVLVMAAYAGLAGCMMPADSVLRALVMGGIGAYALLRGRRAQGMSLLCVTVAASIVFSPALARSMGFALSCAAVAGIVWWARPIGEALATFVPEPVAEAVGVTVAAQALTLPLQMLMESQLPLLSVPANLLVAPVVAFATVAGLLGLAVSWLSPAAGFACAWIASCGTRLMEVTALWCADSPIAVLLWAEGAAGAMLLLVLETVAALAVRWAGRARIREADGAQPPGRASPYRPHAVARLGRWLDDTLAMLRAGTWSTRTR